MQKKKSFMWWDSCLFSKEYGPIMPPLRFAWHSKFDAINRVWHEMCNKLHHLVEIKQRSYQHQEKQNHVSRKYGPMMTKLH